MKIEGGGVESLSLLHLIAATEIARQMQAALAAGRMPSPPDERTAPVIDFSNPNGAAGPPVPRRRRAVAGQLNTLASSRANRFHRPNLSFSHARAACSVSGMATSMSPPAFL